MRVLTIFRIICFLLDRLGTPGRVQEAPLFRAFFFALEFPLTLPPVACSVHQLIHSGHSAHAAFPAIESSPNVGFEAGIVLDFR
jgi:hypothetical protein